MYYYEHRDDIAHRVENTSIVHLEAMWERLSERRGSTPLSEDFEGDRVAWCSGDLMLLEPLPGNDYRYLLYGRNIARAAGFDMTGRRTSEFESEVGEFFREKYRECIRGGLPIYTVHQASHAADVHTWERLILPLNDREGNPRLLVYNRPLALRSSFLESVLASAMNGLIALAALRDGDEIQDFQILLVNDAAADIIGRARDELEGRRLNDVLAGLMGRSTFELCVRVAETGSVEQREVETGRGDGHRAHVVRASRTRDGVILALDDVTRHVRREEALRESEARLRAAQRLAALGSWEWNLETDAVWWSEQSFAIYGERPGSFEPTLRTLARAVHPDDWRRVQAALKKTVDEGVPFAVEHRIVRPDGEERLIRSQGELMPASAVRPPRVVGASFDVTEPQGEGARGEGAESERD